MQKPRYRALATAGWLASGGASGATGPGHFNEARLQHAPRFSAGHRSAFAIERARRASVAAGEDGAGPDRHRESEARPAQLRLGRQRHVEPPCRRALRAARGYRRGARAFQRHSRGAHGYGRGTRALHDRQPCLDAAAREGRPLTAARGDEGETLADAARSADDRRNASGLRIHRLDGISRADQSAASDRRQATTWMWAPKRCSGWASSEQGNRQRSREVACFSRARAASISRARSA